MFTLVVDDFAVKFHTRDAADHLLSSIRQEYKIEADWDASTYLGMTITQDRVHHTISLSMPGYVAAAAKLFNVTKASRPTHTPLKYSPPFHFTSDPQLAVDDTSPPLAPVDVTFIQQVIGKFLYYARAVDSTMLCPLNKLASRQALPTEDLLADVHHFLQYAVFHPSASVVFHPSKMILMTHSDASYLSESKSRSRAAGLHWLSDTSDPLTAPLNGAIEAISVIIDVVVASAAEAELAAIFINAQCAVATRNTLLDLGYPQPTTAIVTDNTTAAGVATQTLRQKRSKAMDMRWYWIQDRIEQRQYDVIWAPGSVNKADYFSKTHPAAYYIEHRSDHVSDITL
jgi:hypothetical protein